MSEKGYIYSFKQRDQSPTNFTILDNTSQKHPRFPGKPGLLQDIDIKHAGTGLSTASTEFLIAPVERKTTFAGHLWGWIQEILCLILSCLSILAVILVLALSNGQQQPKLPFAITLNTVVSYLGIIYKTSLLGVVSSCIGQLKWCWYKTRGGLNHFDVFDGVGRSPLIAFLIFFSWKPYKWIYFGALIMLMTAVADPFLQQVISSPLVAVPTGSASIPRTQSYDANADLTDLQAGVQGQFDYGLKAAIYQGLFAPEGSSDISFTCPSGNCTYPDFDSLAFCSKCTNITGQVTTSNNPILSDTDADVQVNLTWKLPFVDPITIHAVLNVDSVEDGPALISVPFKTSISKAATGIVYPLVSFSLLHWGQLDTTSAPGNPHGNYSQEPPEAYQCAIYFCLNSYSVKASDGRLSSVVTSTYIPPEGTPLGEDDDDYNRFANVTNLVIQRPDSFPQTSNNDTFFVPRASVGIFAQYMQHFFTGYQAIRNASPFSDAPQLYDANGYPAGFPPLPFMNDTMSVFTNQTFADVPKILEGMTTTMTNYIRRAGSGQDNGSVEGASFTLIPLTRVDFRWLAFPIALIVFGMIFLMYTAVHSAKLGIPIWKDSVLPALFHGLNEVTQHSIAITHGVPMTTKEMETVAKSTGVLLQRSGNGDLKLTE